jgi:hypothetical protein
MSLPRSVADILREHVTLEVEGIDRMYLNAYGPGLQYASGVAAFQVYKNEPPGEGRILFILHRASRAITP